MAYDIVGGGNYEIVGADDDLDMLLAAASGDTELPAGINPQIAAALMKRGALMVKEQGFTKAREYPLGFASVGAVAAGGAARITTQPQVVFRVERLVIPSDIGGSFVIDDLVVGKNSQFAATNIAVPARVFDERAVGVRLKGDTAQVAQDVLLAVTNISGAGITFRAAVIGSVVE